MKRKLAEPGILFLCILLLAGCEDAERGPKDYPFVQMDNVDVLSDGVTFQARITSPGTQNIVSYGFVWNETDNTEFETWSEKELTGILSGGTFQAEVHTDIVKDQVYHVRPFVKTVETTVFGPVTMFTGRGSRPARVTDYSPKEGFDGTVVKMYGSNFSQKQGNLSVFVDIAPAEIIISSEDSLVFKIPETPLAGRVRLKVVSGDREIIIENAFEIFGPEIFESSVTEGYAGDIITIRGKNLTHYGPPTLHFDAFVAETIESEEDQVTAVIPFVNNFYHDKAVSVSFFSGQKFGGLNTPFTVKKSWDTKTPTPFDWTWTYDAFSYNGKGYILEINAKLLYEYDPVADSWDPVSDFPGERSENNIFLPHDDKFIVIGGNTDGASCPVWEYDFTTKIWTRQDDAPFIFTLATHVTLNGLEYIITDSGLVCTYNYSTRGFTKKYHFLHPVNLFLFAYIANGKIHLVTYGSTWSYDEGTDSWTKVSDNQFEKDYYYVPAIGFYYSGSPYVLEDGVELYKYLADYDRWVLCGYYPGCRGDNSYKTVFVIGDYAYVAATTSNFDGCAPLHFAYRDR